MVQLLIADDEMIERAVLCKTLRKNLGDQCTIFQAENGREALEIYRKEQIQIALLDIEMPKLNGIETFERMKEFAGDIPRDLPDRLGTGERRRQRHPPGGGQLPEKAL